MLFSTANPRYLLPVVASGLLSFTLCAFMAIFLYREQSTSAEALQENVESHRAAADLQENLADLAALLRDRVDGVSALNERISGHIRVCQSYIDNPEEQLLVQRVVLSFQHYMSLWRKIPERPGPEHDEQIRDSLTVIETQTLKECQELRDFGTRQIDDANQEHRSTLRRLSWGLAGIGGSAGIAGLFLGLGIARGLSRSIQRVQVRVQDAVGKLGSELPAVELPTGGDLNQLDLQVQTLVSRIEDVVARLQQREREIRRAEQLAAVGQLAAGMAHEIRNPLTSIKMLVQAAREDGSVSLSTDDLDVVEREIRRVERSLQTFLDFARPPRPSKAPADMRTILRETLDLTRGRLSRQNVSLRFEPRPSPIDIEGDAGQLRQVFVNLVLNALDAMPQGGLLWIELEKCHNEACVRVRDSGPGISSNIEERLFQPFASTRETGLGLGLVICKQIVEEHGGTIEGENQPNAGAIFEVRLPMRSHSTASD